MLSITHVRFNFNRETRNNCLSLRIFGLPEAKNEHIKDIKASNTSTIG